MTLVLDMLSKTHLRGHVVRTIRSLTTNAECKSMLCYARLGVTPPSHMSPPPTYLMPIVYVALMKYTGIALDWHVLNRA
jgi:hypothetical protein